MNLISKVIFLWNLFKSFSAFRPFSERGALRRNSIFWFKKGFLENWYQLRNQMLDNTKIPKVCFLKIDLGCVTNNKLLLHRKSFVSSVAKKSSLGKLPNNSQIIRWDRRKNIRDAFILQFRKRTVEKIFVCTMPS